MGVAPASVPTASSGVRFQMPFLSLTQPTDYYYYCYCYSYHYYHYYYHHYPLLPPLPLLYE